MSAASSGQESNPGASSSIREVWPPQAAPKFTPGYGPPESFREMTKASITMSTLVSAHCFASDVSLVAAVWPKYTATFSVECELNTYPDALGSVDRAEEISDAGRVEIGDGSIVESATGDTVRVEELGSAKNTPLLVGAVDDGVVMSMSTVNVKTSSIVTSLVAVM